MPTATSSPTATRGRATASAVEAPPDQAQVPRGVAKKGERWAVEVVASDGEAESPAARHEAVIADTAPGPTAVALCDGPVPAGTVLAGAGHARVVRRRRRPRHLPPRVDRERQACAAAQGQARLAAPALRKHDLVLVGR